ncbi:COG3677 Transposase and inactivated derivatives [Vibrio sp. B1FLJ16]|nr:COG3677 Transposase and inactivated derivatives [Vibrio sp. B1FLJ16]CAE6933790.1 COG3677 Transposase and inactivated derivatives [Vibrio sp. B1FLJ16]
MYVEEEPSWNMNSPFGKVDIVYMSWWRDRWAISSQADVTGQAESTKGICYLAGDNNEPQKWFNVATTRQIQFYQSRFQLLFESFINEPRRKLRPGGILPLLDIFRAWHNLCYQDKEGLTAAQRLEVTDAPLTIKQLLS